MNKESKIKDIWIFHHYATPPSMSGLTRSYDFSKKLIKKGYSPKIFSSGYLHYSSENIILDKSLLKEIVYDKVPFVFIRTTKYKKSKLLRVLNIVSYYKNALKVAKIEAKDSKGPDVILGSSAHPLAAVAAIKLGKKYKCQSIVEIRDLWPESFVAYGIISKKNPLLKLLYLGEKWIYKNADKLIFTMEGGKDYIIDKKWDKRNGGPIDISKVYHVNNGVDLEEYDNNIKNYQYADADLDDDKAFKVVYAGSIRRANNLSLLIDAAQYIKKRSDKNIKFIIFGDGDEKEKLFNRCITEQTGNIIFKGSVDKKYIPNILSKSNLNILNYSYHKIWKYGGSQNKNFEYLASGKPILSTITMGYDIIKKYNAGISLKRQDSETIGEAIISVANMDYNDYQNMADNARHAAEDYDFKALTKKLTDIIQE